MIRSLNFYKIILVFYMTIYFANVTSHQVRNNIINSTAAVPNNITISTSPSATIPVSNNGKKYNSSLPCPSKRFLRRKNKSRENVNKGPKKNKNKTINVPPSFVTTSMSSSNMDSSDSVSYDDKRNDTSSALNVTSSPLNRRLSLIHNHANNGTKQPNITIPIPTVIPSLPSHVDMNLNLDLDTSGTNENSFDDDDNSLSQ